MPTMSIEQSTFNMTAESDLMEEDSGLAFLAGETLFDSPSRSQGRLAAINVMADIVSNAARRPKLTRAMIKLGGMLNVGFRADSAPGDLPELSADRPPARRGAPQSSPFHDPLRTMSRKRRRQLPGTSIRILTAAVLLRNLPAPPPNHFLFIHLLILFLQRMLLVLVPVVRTRPRAEMRLPSS